MKLKLLGEHMCLEFQEISSLTIGLGSESYFLVLEIERNMGLEAGITWLETENLTRAMVVAVMFGR